MLAHSGTSGGVTDVAAGPGGWVAVGSAETADDLENGERTFRSRTGVVWTSADGSSWGAPITPSELAGAQLFGVAWTTRGYMAVGSVRVEGPDPDNPGGSVVRSAEPAAWRSPDGVVWTRLPVEAVPADGDDGGRLNAVVEAHDRLVGVGCLDEACVRGPAMWLADPGGTLRRVETERLPATGFADNVVATSAGYVATGGFASIDGGSYRAAAWTSADGTIWRPAADFEAASYSLLLDVAASSDGLLAVGQASDAVAAGVDSRVAIWRSVDSGRTWALAPGPGPNVRAGAWLDVIVWTGGAYIAMGRVISAQPVRPAAWRSADGIGWEPVAIAGLGAGPTAAADGPGGVVAVGGSYGPWIGDDPPEVLPDVLSWRSPAGQ